MGVICSTDFAVCRVANKSDDSSGLDVIVILVALLAGSISYFIVSRISCNVCAYFNCINFMLCI